MTTPGTRPAATDTDADRRARLDIAALLVRYASGIDRRDWGLFRTCFTADCEADYGRIGAWHGVDALTAHMERAHEPCGHTLHRVGNPDIALRGGAATARSYCDAVVLRADDSEGVNAVGYFDDDLVRTGDGWRIARRRYTAVLMQPVRQAPRPE